MISKLPLILIHTLLVFFCASVFNGASSLAYADDVKPGILQFGCWYDGHAFIYILSHGDNKKQTAMVTVFEVTGTEKLSIRRLHQVDLANRCFPNSHILCGAGRFFLTFDDGYLWADARKAENFLAVYDLVRNERRVFRFSDIFTDEFFVDRGYPNGVAFTDCRQRLGSPEQHFNPTLVTFRIPLPRARIESDPPVFHVIEIDLLAKTAKVERANKYVETHDYSAERRCTIDAYNGEEQKSRLPRLLRFGNFRRHSECVFELDERTLEYQQVSADLWVTESLVKSRCDDGEEFNEQICPQNEHKHP